MTDEDDRANAPTDKTVFAPGPRAPLPVAPPVVGPVAPAANPADRTATPPRQPQIRVSQRSYPPPTSDTTAGEAWIRTEDQKAGPELLPPAARAPSIEDLVVPHENPIMQAAGPILLLLGRLRVAVLQASPASLMEQVAAAIEFFEKEIRNAGVAAEPASDAKYIVCATADDIVQNIPTEDRHVWTRDSMLSRFFGERVGGVRFFEKLDRAKLDPLRNYPLLELIHCCLALGFQGRYRTEPSGVANLQQIQRNLYELLRKVHPHTARDLSPHWRGHELAHTTMRARIPFSAIAGVVGLALVAVFFTLRAFLSDGADIATAAVRKLGGTGEIRLARPESVPPPLTPKGAVCPTELPSGVTCKAAGGSLTFSVESEVLFDSGQAVLKKDFVETAAALATFLDKEAGAIRVVGHTDNVKLRKTSPFASNWELSMERAKAVATVLKPKLSDPSRLETDGRGDEEPVASNETKDGRARNRRVEIKLARSIR
jgi:type VI secretion system protein ImpK